MNKTKTKTPNQDKPKSKLASLEEQYAFLDSSLHSLEAEKRKHEQRLNELTKILRDTALHSPENVVKFQREATDLENVINHYNTVIQQKRAEISLIKIAIDKVTQRIIYLQSVHQELETTIAINVSERVKQLRKESERSLKAAEQTERDHLQQIRDVEDELRGLNGSLSESESESELSL